MAQSTRFKNFVGPTYNLKNYKYDCQRLVNRYVEYDETQSGKDAEPAQLAPSPGLTALLTGLDGPSRGGYAVSTSEAYWVFGNKLYELRGTTGSTGWTAVPHGSIAGNQTCQFSYNNSTLFIVCPDIGDVYTYTTATDTLLIQDTSGGGGGNIIGLGNLVGGAGYVDGVYYSVPVTGGVGIGCVLNITVSGGIVTNYELILGGLGYNGGDTITVPNTYLGGSGSGFSIQVIIVGEGWLPAISTTYLDGYNLFAKKDSNQFYWTDLYSTNIIGFAAAETNANNIVGIMSNNEDLWIFCDNVTELWFDYGGGATGNDIFQRRSGILVETGCHSAATIQKLDNTIIWLSRDPRGGSSVEMANGYTPVTVSTYAIQQILGKANSDQLALAEATTYQYQGHNFYQLDVPGIDTTLIFDLTCYQQTGKLVWHERQYGYGLQAGRSLAQGHIYFMGKHVVGDNTTGNLYFLDVDNNTDNGQIIGRTRITPHVSNSLKRMRHTSLQIDFTPGTVTDGQNPPQVMLQYSDDGGLTWSNERWCGLGEVGQHQNRVIFYKLGVTRDRVYKIVDVNNCYSGISGAEILVEPGQT